MSLMQLGETGINHFAGPTWGSAPSLGFTPYPTRGCIHSTPVAMLIGLTE